MVYTTKSSEGKTLGGGYVEEGHESPIRPIETPCRYSIEQPIRHL